MEDKAIQEMEKKEDTSILLTLILYICPPKLALQKLQTQHF